MRTIKFRAWASFNHHYDEKTQYMAYQGTPDNETIQSFMHHWGNYELMQFTGLLDKNSKEIYEGDIVEVNKKTVGIVEYTKRACFAVRWNLSNGLTVKKTLFWATEKGCEVIGNIYENPELDKVEK